MSSLDLLRVGHVESGSLEALQARLAAEFGVPCRLRPDTLEPSFAYHAERGQYHSSEIIARMQAAVDQRTWRLLGVTAADLYIPILTFVFGEAHMEGPCAVVSTHRLRQEFYGLPGDDVLVQRRLFCEAVHELGHTLGLRHCDDYECAMSASHSVELIDLKNPHLCDACRSAAGLGVSRREERATAGPTARSR
jgi:archaemetzincin